MKTNDETVKASFIASELIAKSSKPFTGDLFIKKCLLKVADAVCPNMKKAFERISVSPNTLSERISDISEEIEHRLVNQCRGFDAF